MFAMAQLYLRCLPGVEAHCIECLEEAASKPQEATKGAS